jgi:DNA-binding NarL/FixJ family response regulator
MIETTLLTNQPIPTAVVSRPGIMQQSLRSSLAACPLIAVVASFGDGLTALNQLTRFHPGILVIDSNLLDEEVDAILAGLKARQPDIRCLVLVRSTWRRDQLLVEGADEVVLRNSSVQDLHDALYRLAQGLTGQSTSANAPT